MSRWIARSQGRHASFFFFTAGCGLAAGAGGGGWSGLVVATSPSAIALFLPRVGVVVIAARLPEARLVDRDEANAGEPLRALPEVEVGHERADRRAVRTRERL